MQKDKTNSLVIKKYEVPAINDDLTRIIVPGYTTLTLYENRLLEIMYRFTIESIQDDETLGWQTLEFDSNVLIRTSTISSITIYYHNKRKRYCVDIQYNCGDACIVFDSKEDAEYMYLKLWSLVFF